MSNKKKDNSVGPWAKEKLDALRQYLDFYTTVLKKQGHWLRGTYFVDAFAGPGLSKIRKKTKATSLFFPEEEPEQEEYLKGSPRVALEITNPFSSYLFIDSDKDRATELEALKKEHARTAIIDVKKGDANVEIQKWLASGIDWKHHRGVVFLDPFGTQLSWATIEAIAKTRALEVIINFPLGMAINRMLPKDGDVPDGWQISLDTLFGSPDWRKIVYQDGHDLFGPKKRKAKNTSEKLLAWYRERLKALFGHVSTPQLIKNTRGNPLYFLIWAGPHATGLKGANHILGKSRTTKRG
jgi:three-Cys-motif partner protein